MITPWRIGVGVCGTLGGVCGMFVAAVILLFHISGSVAVSWLSAAALGFSLLGVIGAGVAMAIPRLGALLQFLAALGYGGCFYAVAGPAVGRGSLWAFSPTLLLLIGALLAWRGHVQAALLP